MLLREADGDGVLAIGQPAHAWVSGQLARAWGSPAFGSVAPWEEVCLAAEQHDIGMAAWDLAPTLNPDTGLPHSFVEMPIEAHLALWRAGPRRLVRQSRHAALLVSMHGVRLYELRDLERMPAARARAVREFIAAQRALQHELLGSLRADPATRADVAPERLQRNSDLVWTWDHLSLALCLGWPPCTSRAVPSAGASVDLALAPVELEPAPAGERAVTLHPWPFARERLTVHAEGQRLSPPYRSPEELHAALARAPWETLRITLAPAPASTRAAGR